MSSLAFLFFFGIVNISIRRKGTNVIITTNMTSRQCARKSCMRVGTTKILMNENYMPLT